MGWIAELFSDFTVDSNEEQQQVFNRALKRLREGHAQSASVDDRVTLLEDDLARMLLLLHALTEAMVQKQVITRSELEAAGKEIDLRDGKADGKLSPAALRQNKDAANNEPDQAVSPEEHLRRLEEGP